MTLRSFPTAGAAHEANNAVMRGAQKLADEHGVAMGIGVYATVEGSAKQIVGVEYSRNDRVEPLVRMFAMMAGALQKQLEKAYKKALDEAAEQGVLFGGEHADELLDRRRVGDEEERAYERGVRDAAAAIEALRHVPGVERAFVGSTSIDKAKRTVEALLAEKGKKP